MKYIKTIIIDISKKIYETIETKSKDTARYLLFKLLDNGVPMDLTGKTVRAYSSNKKFNDLIVVSAKDGLCELKLTNEFLGVNGLNQVELTVYEGLDTLSTMIFYVNNIACLRDDAAIEATNEFSALTVALNKVEVLDKNLNMASTDLEKKYTTRLTGLESQLEDNALNSIETDISLTKLNSVLDGNLMVDKIQGRTLVNVLNYSTTEDIINSTSVDADTKYITTSRTTDGDIYNYINKGRMILKPSTVYSFIIDIQNTTLTKPASMLIGECGAGTNSPWVATISFKPEKGIKIVKLTTKPDISAITLDCHTTLKVLANETITYRLMVLEGDYTTTRAIPQFFTGMKSVGEDNSNKIEISSVGKNLFPPISEPKTLNGVTLTCVNGVYTLNGTCTSSVLFMLGDYYLDGGSYTLKANTELIPANNSDALVQVYSAVAQNELLIRNNTPIDSAVTKNIPSGMWNFRFRVTGGVTYNNFKIKPQLEKNTVATAFEPYKQDKSEISLASPLREWDYIDEKGYHVLSGTRSYQTGDETNPNCITDKTNTVYKLSQEILKPLNESLILSAFKDGYFGLNCGAINPVVSLRFPTNMGERVTGVEESTIYLRNRYYESLKVQLQLLAKNVELETNKQNKTDSTLTTTSKEIAGAINENKAAIDSVKTTRDKEPTINNFTFSSNAENRLPTEDMSVYYKKDGIVRLHVNARKDASSTPFAEGWITLGTLPVGYRPTKSKFTEGCINSYNSCTSQPFRVTNTGEVSCHLNNSIDTYIIGDIEFYAGGGTI